MSILSNLVVPSWAGPLAVAVAFAAVGGYAGLQTVRLAESKAETAKAQRDAATVQAGAERRAQIATQDALETERGRATAQLENMNESLKQSETARADSDRAGAALGRLLQRAEARAAARGDAVPSSASAAASGPAASVTGLVPADVLRGLGEAAQQLAAVADQRGAAGLLCQKDYSALVK